MKKITILLFLILSLSALSQTQTVTYNINPASFNEGDTITITFNGNSINEATWGVAGNALYLWSWSYDLNDINSQDCPTNGTWNSSNEANRLTYNAGSDTYTITFKPTSFYSRTGIGRIGFLIKPKNGKPSTIDMKSQDLYSGVGSFQVTLTNPIENSVTVISSGGSLNITATNTNGNASYNLKANGSSINTNAATTSYAFSHTNITVNQNYQLETTQASVTITKKFSVIVNPNTVTQALPAGLVEGINYNPSDATKATLVIDAPLKDFIYVAGSFNNWQPNATYAMKKDSTPLSTKFWLELTGLTAGQIETYQYWVVDQTPITNSPVLVKTADPFSTLVLSPFDDSGIPSASYPNLPAYPAGQEREVTVLQTGQTSYNWQVTNFSKPKKEDLIIYEVLIRDFDADRNYQDLIDKIDYFKNLNINAIELMPIMEFEGNESWGYNTAFHMALDKFYGTSNKFKELVDLCHQNGIAIILDIALNHAFGRNPMVRMWMNDPDGDGWGSPSSENPYFNTTAKHSYSVGEDFNHQSTYTQNYVNRVINHWISEYKIDGFRWDLTKGFTQNCTSGDQTCTNNYQQDRVDILKKYADYSWAADPTHYVIFEHLGGDSEEQQWANYRIGDAIPKGIMMWGNMHNDYKEFAKGNNSNISRATSESRGFTKRRLIAYPESHDEERIMYDMLQSANTSNLNVALSRMSEIGATNLLIPGPKMIWHFGELGMNNSIFTCNNETVSNPNCKLDTKPQPQWTNNWLADVNRNKIYTDWSRLNKLKINEPVFEGNATLEGTTRTVRLFIWDDAIPSATLKNVVVLANFYTVDQSITPDFPYTGIWYDLMDNSPINITSTTALIPVAAGQFRIFGNKASTLGTSYIKKNTDLILYPNPANDSFSINKNVEVLNIYDITGKIVSSFKGNFDKGHTFDISSLSKSIYLIKIINSVGEESTNKLVKL